MKSSVVESGNSAAAAWKRYLSWAVAQAILFWFFTLLAAFEMMAGGVWDLLRIEYVRVVLGHLGYPMYLLTILGIWKIPCAIVMLVPRFSQLKEWAYAGAFFTYSGAFASHYTVGDGAALLMPPLVLALFTLASWAMRPANRRFSPDSKIPETETGIWSWVVPILIVAAFLILSFLTLPAGPPPALAGS